jgi:hypothetical protein
MTPLASRIVDHWLALTYCLDGATAKALAQHFNAMTLHHFLPNALSI